MEIDELGMFQEQPAVTETPMETPVVEADKGETTAPPAVSEESRGVPVTALLDEREKRQAAQRRAEELERKIAEYEAARQPSQAPDFLDNPDGRLAYEREAMQRALWDERCNTSELVAREKHGDDLVTEATQAFLAAAQQNPALSIELRQKPHPYAFVVDWHKRQRVLSEIGTDPDAYRARIEAEIRARVMAELQPQQPLASASPAPRAVILPPSVTSAAPAGGEAETPGSAFDAVFARR